MRSDFLIVPASALLLYLALSGTAAAVADQQSVAPGPDSRPCDSENPTLTNEQQRSVKEIASRGGGQLVLFVGSSGTGKAMAASAIAAELGVEVYRIDSARVLSKYIGETEKNLAQILDRAEAMRAVLLFDEADALFGKRTGVRDARDRYANVEVGYLLQRMQTYPGIIILAGKLARHFDPAILRRAGSVVESAESSPGPCRD